MCRPMGGIPKIVGQGYISGGNIWRFPYVSLYASGAQLVLDTPLVQTLPKAQQTQGIEYFDSFNIFGSKQKLQQALKS